MCAQEYFRDPIKGWHVLPTWCNTDSYSAFVIATHVIYSTNFSITDELLRNLLGKIYVQGYVSRWSHQG